MKVRNYRDVRPDTALPGVALHTVISAEDGAPRFAMRVFELQPGAATPLHTHWWEHEVFILSGSGKVKGREGERELGPGDAVYLAGEEEHCFVNTSSELFRFICCIPHTEAAAPAPSPACEGQA